MPAHTARTSSVLAPALALCLLLTTAPAEAHFQNFLARILHLEAAEGGTLIHARLPLASVLLPSDWNPDDPGRGVPFVQPARPQDAADALLLDPRALAGAPDALRSRLGNALQLVRDPATGSAAPAPPLISAIRIQPISERSPFSHLSQIRAALTAPLDISPQPLALADAVVDFRAFYADVPYEHLVEIRSNPREWPGIAGRSINILTLHRDDERTRLSSAGALQQRLVGETPPAQGLGDSIRSGYRHVLIGLDHVLFMLILILAARHWRGFLRNSLAFTLGHSITLAIGAAGLLSAAPWFIPLVETAIALSILYSGACLLLGAAQRLLAARVFFIGLLHGLGFAFVLQQASGQAPGDLLLLWLGFNLGIEAGQLTVYLAAAPLLWLLSRHWPLPRLSFRTLLAAPCLIAASVWTLQRGLDLVVALGVDMA